MKLITKIGDKYLGYVKVIIKIDNDLQVNRHLILYPFQLQITTTNWMLQFHLTIFKAGLLIAFTIKRD